MRNNKLTLFSFLLALPIVVAIFAIPNYAQASGYAKVIVKANIANSDGTTQVASGTEVQISSSSTNNWKQAGGSCYGCSNARIDNKNNVQSTITKATINSSSGTDFNGSQFACGNTQCGTGDNGSCNPFRITITNPSNLSGGSWNAILKDVNLANDGTVIVVFTYTKSSNLSDPSNITFVKMQRNPKWDKLKTEDSNFEGNKPPDSEGKDWNIKIETTFTYWTYSSFCAEEKTTTTKNADGSTTTTTTCVDYDYNIDTNNKDPHPITKTLQNVYDRVNLSFTYSPVAPANTTSSSTVVSEMSSFDTDGFTATLHSRNGGNGSWTEGKSFSEITADSNCDAPSSPQENPPSSCTGNDILTKTTNAILNAPDANNKASFYFVNVGYPVVTVTKEVCALGNILDSEIFKTATTCNWEDKETINPGNVVGYRVTIKNDGADRAIIENPEDQINMKTVAVDPDTVKFPPGFDYDGIDGEVVGNKVTWLYEETLLPGSSAVFYFVARTFTMWDGSDSKNEIDPKCTDRKEGSCGSKPTNSISSQAGTAKSPPIWREIAP